MSWVTREPSMLIDCVPAADDQTAPPMALLDVSLHVTWYPIPLLQSLAHIVSLSPHSIPIRPLKAVRMVAPVASSHPANIRGLNTSSFAATCTIHEASNTTIHGPFHSSIQHI